MKAALDAVVMGLAALVIVVVYAIYAVLAVGVVICVIRAGQFIWRVTA